MLTHQLDLDRFPRSFEELKQNANLVIAIVNENSLIDCLYASKKFQTLFCQVCYDVSYRHSRTSSDRIRWWTTFQSNDFMHRFKSLQKTIAKNGISPPGSPCNQAEFSHRVNVSLYSKDEVQSEHGINTAWAIAVSCQQSPKFFRNFLKYTNVHSSVHGHYRSQIPSTCVDNINLKKLVVIKTHHNIRQWIDFKWECVVRGLVWKRMLLEDAMSWLNTLGGGYSALGDYFTHHAEAAGHISYRQLKIAVEMGDPSTVIRCRLYFAISLMQRGFLRKAKYIIRQCYRSARELPVTDSRLLASCEGIWSRLAFLYLQRHAATSAHNAIR